MLKSISWLQFGSFLLAIGASYYLYVLGRYYRSEIKSLLTGRRQPIAVKATVAPLGRSIPVIVGHPKVRDQDRLQERSTIVTGSTPGVGELTLSLPEEATADDESGDKLFGVMGNVIVLLKEEMRQAIENETSRDEILPRLAVILGKYGQLKGSQYQPSINDFLVRSCSSKFALLLGEEELEGLWN